MQQLITPVDCQAFRKQYGDLTIALVATMGALHGGHMALVETAKQHADIVVVSIFVNPIQFGPNEDYTRYPRPLEADLTQCQAAGVDAVFIPNVETLYPQGLEQPACLIQPPLDLAQLACGASRPGHFAGVCTVVGKLLNIIQPNVAIFGEKDAQQLAIIQRLVNDLNWPVTIVPHPLERELSGLAISSRNQYLTDASDKAAALLLSRWLDALTNFVNQSQPNLPAYQAYGLARELAFADVPDAVKDRFHLDYIVAMDDTTFTPVDTLSPSTRILLAAWVGDPPNEKNGHRVRLIDNHVLGRGAFLPKANGGGVAETQKVASAV